MIEFSKIILRTEAADVDCIINENSRLKVHQYLQSKPLKRISSFEELREEASELLRVLTDSPEHIALPPPQSSTEAGMSIFMISPPSRVNSAEDLFLNWIKTEFNLWWCFMESKRNQKNESEIKKQLNDLLEELAFLHRDVVKRGREGQELPLLYREGDLLITMFRNALILGFVNYLDKNCVVEILNAIHELELTALIKNSMVLQHLTENGFPEFLDSEKVWHHLHQRIADRLLKVEPESCTSLLWAEIDKWKAGLAHIEDRRFFQSVVTNLNLKMLQHADNKSTLNPYNYNDIPSLLRIRWSSMDPDKVWAEAESLKRTIRQMLGSSTEIDVSSGLRTVLLWLERKDVERFESQEKHSDFKKWMEQKEQTLNRKDFADELYKNERVVDDLRRKGIIWPAPSSTKRKMFSSYLLPIAKTFLRKDATVRAA